MTSNVSMNTKSEFYKVFNEFKPSDIEDRIINDISYCINSSITSIISSNNLDNINANTKNSNNEIFNNKEETSFDTYIKICDEIIESNINVQDNLNQTFINLNKVIKEKNNITDVLIDFNSSCKKHIEQQEKNALIIEVIEKNLNFYQEPQVISSYVKTCICLPESHRFFRDYEIIENGLVFFNMHSDYIQSDYYLREYKNLKQLFINKYTEYVSKNLNYEMNKESEYIDIFPLPNNMSKQTYFLPANYKKVLRLNLFMDERSRNDYEIYNCVSSIKKNFIYNRITLIKPYLSEILIDENFDINEIVKLTICEVFYFKFLFQCKLINNQHALNLIIYQIYEYLYTVLKPIIVKTEKIDLLCQLFDKIATSFNIFFKENVDYTEFLNLLNKFKKKTNENLVMNDNNTNCSDVFSKNDYSEIINVINELISPFILKLIQDIQEKLYFIVSYQIKYSFVEFENQFENFESHFHKISKLYFNFNLFHHYIKKTCVILDILNNKLDKEILSELAISCIDLLINELNKESLNVTKKLDYDFQIYLVQQIILAIKLVEEFKLEIKNNIISFDFYNFTDLLKESINIGKSYIPESSNHLNELIFGKANPKKEEIIFSSIKSNYIIDYNTQKSDHLQLSSFFNANNNSSNNSELKSETKVKYFKKTMYNILFKSYNMLIQIINDYIFSKELIMKVNLINRNKESNIENEVFINYDDMKNVEIEKIYDKFSEIIRNLQNQLECIDKTAYNKISILIYESVYKLIEMIYKSMSEDESIKEFKDYLWVEIENKNLSRIKNSLDISNIHC